MKQRIIISKVSGKSIRSLFSKKEGTAKSSSTKRHMNIFSKFPIKTERIMIPITITERIIRTVIGEKMRVFFLVFDFKT